jgi:hypothetical protein
MLGNAPPAPINYGRIRGTHFSKFLRKCSILPIINGGRGKHAQVTDKYRHFKFWMSLGQHVSVGYKI